MPPILRRTASPCSSASCFRRPASFALSREISRVEISAGGDSGAELSVGGNGGGETGLRPKIAEADEVVAVGGPLGVVGLLVGEHDDVGAVVADVLAGLVLGAEEVAVLELLDGVVNEVFEAVRAVNVNDDDRLAAVGLVHVLAGEDDGVVVVQLPYSCSSSADASARTFRDTGSNDD